MTVRRMDGAKRYPSTPAGVAMGIAALHPSYETRFRDLAAHCVRGLHLGCPPREERAQGRPGACCTRGLACDLRKQNCTRAYRAAGAFRPSLRNGFTAYSALSPVNGSFATVAYEKLASQELNASTAAPEPHDFAVRFTHARLRALRVHRISPHVRDDGQRPSIG